MKLLSAEQVRQWDAYTIQHEPVSSLELMERAAAACARWIVDRGLFDRPVKLFCGKGNNGGDGLAIARLLIDQEVDVEVFILEFGSKGTDDFQANLTRLHRTTKHIHFIQTQSAFPVINESDLVIDALFGYGFNRPLDGLAASLVQHINASASTVVSIDIPSGMFPDRSSAGNVVVQADHTLTFQSLKLCLLAADNSDSFGAVQVLDIGLVPRFLNEVATRFYLTGLNDVKAMYRPRAAFAHKGRFGHSLIIGGTDGKAGAAIIAAEASLRSGAGLTSVHLLGGDNTAINARCPEVMTVSGDSLVKKNLQQFDSIAIGPGLGTDDIAAHLVSLLIESYAGRLVMDADALNVMSQHKEWMSQLLPGTILTPHPKEFDRLFGQHDGDFERWETALAVSKSLRCVIVLKGHNSLIADEGIGHFNSTGNAGLAKGGSGDALTGIIAALLAQGYNASQAARLGVFLHGSAADIAVQDQSYESLVASDVIASLGQGFKKLSNVS